MYQVIWLSVVIATAIIEALTAGLVIIWFTVGAFFALLSAILGASPTVQIIVFILVSALSLVLTKPLIKKHVTAKTQKTNADRLVGKICEVTESIDNIKAVGAVKAEGLTWSAKSTDGPIQKGQLVTIVDIKGAHAVVQRVNK